ncbi:MAG: sensor histidine kinase [Pseudomonadota bacterium]|nr:sensor histidine kinase [Pseudomonadota bacterium]
MRFSSFIIDNLDAIVEEWEAFARTLLPSAKSMSVLALRDHSREILTAIAKDMETAQTEAERTAKSKVVPTSGASHTIAAAHGVVRQSAGFDLAQLVAEFRAMRASVLALWRSVDPVAASPLAIDEIARFNEAIDQALAESVESYSRDVAMFLAVIGHELRTPLWTIQGSSEVLAMKSAPEATKAKATERIWRASKTMAHMVTDLLEYTRTRLGHGVPIERSDCDMAAACKKAVEAIQSIHPNQQFEQQISGELHIQADCPRVQQVLTNLLNNAVHHGDPHSPVRLTAVGEEDAVVIEVVNFGRPIPPEALDSIFDPMVQASAAMFEPKKQQFTSMGLGLSIVREIVRGHDGTVTVESSADAGTVVTLRLPLAA